MDKKNHDSSDDRPVISTQGTAKIEEINGKRVARFQVDPSMQGHTFALDISDETSEPMSKGPYLIEYVLGSEFAIYQTDLPSFVPEDGFSHLAMSPDLVNRKTILKYNNSRSPNTHKEATLTFKGSNKFVQRLVVESQESELEDAVKYTNQIVADLLDAIVFVKRIPISIQHIEVTAIGEKYHRQYITLPYGARDFTASDIVKATTIPARIKPAVRLFREGVSSNKPHYRLLCFYRVREVIAKIRSQNNKDVLSKGDKPKRELRILPDNEFTQKYFPDVVSKSVNAFLDKVRSEFRLDIAHGNLNEYFNLILDPADVRIDHRIDFTNAILMPVMAEMIQDEIDFMIRHKIG